MGDKRIVITLRTSIGEPEIDISVQQIQSNHVTQDVVSQVDGHVWLAQTLTILIEACLAAQPV